MSGKKHKKQSAREGTQLSECKAFVGALEKFLDGRLAVESSAVLEAAISAASSTRNLNDAFNAVLETGAVSMSDALHLAMFMNAAAGPAEDAGDPPIGTFSANEAFAEIAQVFDRGVSDMVDEAFDDSDDSDSESEDGQ